MVTEADVRAALRANLLASAPPSVEVIYEFWVPQSNERADVAVVGAMLDGFEIKTDRDSLKRLPRQVAAYSRVFDRCHAVLAPRHVDQATEMLPSWWGVLVIDHGVRFRVLRDAQANAAVDAETLVRLLWRDEAYTALCNLGCRPDPGVGRFRMWELLLTTLDLDRLKGVVRDLLLLRDPANARIPSQRFAAS